MREISSSGRTPLVGKVRFLRVHHCFGIYTQTNPFLVLDEGIFVSQAEVARQTPLAATSHGDSHIVFAGSNQPTTIKHRVYEGSLGGYSKTIDTGVQFYPGSHLGLVSHDDNVFLFYLDVHSGALKTKKYQKLSGWVDGVVVAA